FRNSTHCFQETPYRIHVQGSNTNAALWDSKNCFQTFIFQVACHKGSPGIHDQHSMLRLLFSIQRCPPGSNVRFGLLWIPTMWQNHMPEPVIRPILGPLHRRSPSSIPGHILFTFKTFKIRQRKERCACLFIKNTLYYLSCFCSLQLSVTASDSQQEGSPVSHPRWDSRVQ
ncbi:hypothetical protein AOXY_G3791, partial [Acipenser oxyrinchus oxyrinchus]